MDSAHNVDGCRRGEHALRFVNKIPMLVVNTLLGA